MDKSIDLKGNLQYVIVCLTMADIQVTITRGTKASVKYHFSKGKKFMNVEKLDHIFTFTEDQITEIVTKLS